MGGLWAAVAVGGEECGDIEEVEESVGFEVGDGVLVAIGVEECGDIEEVEVAFSGEVGGAV